MNVYKQFGFNNRKDYLNSLAEELDCCVTTVYALADMLGESEDFDGLVTMLEDYVGF